MCVGTPRNSRGPPFGGGRNRLEPSKEPEERVEGTGLLESFHGLTGIIWKINIHQAWSFGACRKIAYIRK